jgi:hypothetical protein
VRWQKRENYVVKANPLKDKNAIRNFTRFLNQTKSSIENQNLEARWQACEIVR